MMISQAIQEFLEAKKADNADLKTLKWYAAMLKPLENQFGSAQLVAISTNDMRALIITLRNRTTSKATLSGYSVALRAFWAWVGHEHGVNNPMIGIKKPTRPKPHPKAIRAEDIGALVRACGNSWIGLRNRAIVFMLADTGVRASGLLTLALDDLDLTRRRAVVHEKFDKSRPVPFTQLTGAVLAAYLARRPMGGAALFCTAHGEPLTYWGLREIIRRLALRARVKGRCNIHSFRHFAAREYLRQGGDLATLAELLGHADVSTTAAHYAVFDTDELAARHDQHSPLLSVFGRLPRDDAG